MIGFDLRKICGLLQWLFKLFPAARSWLRFLYLDLIVHQVHCFSCNRVSGTRFLDCLSDDLHFTRLQLVLQFQLGANDFLFVIEKSIAKLILAGSLWVTDVSGFKWRTLHQKAQTFSAQPRPSAILDTLEQFYKALQAPVTL